MRKTTPFIKNAYFTIFFLFTISFAFSQQSQKFSTPGTYTFTVPAGVTSIDIEAWGAGGAGGGATGTNSSGGGGAGGGYVKKTAYSVVAGNTYSVTVGAGGIGDQSWGYSGNPSWFVSTSTIYAVGGNGGNATASNNTYASGAVALTTGNVGFTSPFNYYGGAGGTYGGGINGGGGGGSSAGIGSNGNPANFTIGGVAVTGGGKGANGSDVDGNGANGSLPSGGGAGANAAGATNRSGGNGANGQVIISWACPVFSLSTTTTASTFCTNNAATVLVTSSTLGLPIGAYTVTYNLTGTNTASGNTATMNVTTAGSGSFSTSILPNTGSTSIVITKLATSTCNNNIIANNSATVVLSATPNITGITPANRIGTGTVTLSAAASAGSISWYANDTGGSALITNTNYTTPSISATTTYYVEATNGSCTSSSRVAIVATVNNPEIALSGNGFTIESSLSNTPNTGDFTNLGSTFVSTPLTRTYRIDNIGSANLTVSAIIIGGLNASEFVASVPTTPITPESSADFTITFTPTALGTRSADVSFTTNDSTPNGLGISELNFKFNIAGTCVSGVTAEINVQGGIDTAPANAYVDIIDGSSAAYGNTGTDYTKNSSNASVPILVGATLTKTFRIQNTGTGPLTLASTPVVITGSANFTVIAQPSSTTIAAGAFLTFTIRFTAATTGDFTAIATITNNDSDEGTYDFVLHGIGSVSGREIDIQGNDVTIVSGDITPDPLDQTDFGTTNIATPISIPYQIFNYGNSLSLTISSITATTGSGFTVSSVPSSVAASSIGSFVVTFTPSVVGTKTATITVNNNDSDEGTYNFRVQANVATAPAITIAPGGVGIVTAGTVSNLKFWLKADSNIVSLTDNTAVTTWSEQSTGSTKNAISPFSKEPKFKHNTTNNVNFNPVINFNGANYMYGGQGFNNRDMFIVVKPTIAMTSATSPQDIYCGDDVTVNKGSSDVTGFEMGNTSGRFVGDVVAYNQAANTAYGVAEISSTKSYSSTTIFNPRHNGTRMGIYTNGSVLATTEVNTGTYKDIINSRFWLGRSEAFDASFKGDILEIINYDIANSTTDNNKIESYLAIKYGITLGVNGTSVNYYNSSAATIYAAEAGYNYNIAGIGRDDISQLNQKQSKTENTVNDITIGLGNIYARNSDNTNTFTNDKDFLVWGNNNGTLLAQPAVIVNISSGITPTLTTQVDFISIGRTWRVIESGGNVPSVKVSVPSTLLTSTITPPGDFLMFISDSPVFSPTSEYRIMKANGSKLETNFDFSGTKYITFGYAPDRTFIRAIDFNGTTGYLDSGNVLDLTPTPSSSFTVSAWIKTIGINQTILSKRNSSFTQGYDLSINSSGKAEMSWMNGTKQSIISTFVMPTGKWHHVSIVYNGSTSIAKLYIDGVEDASKTLTNSQVTTQSFLIGAADGTTPTSFFNGTIDEVRVWSVALTEAQLRYVMNQEIKSNGASTNGSIIPNTITSNDISSIPWANLSAYYPMSTYTFTNAKDISNNNYTAALRNLTTVNLQSAPLPYESATSGNWETLGTWLNSDVQDLPNSVSISDNAVNIDWNIVKATHNITSVGNKTVLGLYVGVGTGSTLTATTNGGLQTDGTKIEVSHYLKLDGKIDLVGRSQLIQKTGSDLDVTSSGSVERDQQGQANKYNYNYWCSPVGTINNTTNNAAFTVAGVLKDGTIPSAPATITWVAGYNGSLSPFSLARYWIYKFDNLANLYANWTQIGETGSLGAGKGFTLKGAGVSGTENLTFLGKPNNGTISNAVAADQLLLTGNPYPSALDANQFITDNIGSIDSVIDGTLYFWEQYATNNTHVLANYQGGYALRNLTGGAAPSSIGVDLISGLGTTSKLLPNRYIPVGQGFFVFGKTVTGGNVTFNNGQREFIKEDSGLSQTTYKRPLSPKGKDLDHWTENSNAPIKMDTYKRIRLGYNSYNETFHRQVLLGFMEEKANSKMNDGYDAVNIDDSPSDMYLLNGENELAIQGEGYFDVNASYPIGVRAEVAGKVSFGLDALENFDESQAVFVYDKVTDSYHSIKNELYEVDLPQGTFNNRFVLRFTDKTLGMETFSTSNTDVINVIVNQNVTVKSTGQTIKNIEVFDSLGRKIDSYKKVNVLQFTLNHLNKTMSGLIVKITLDNNVVVTKKIVY